MMTGILGTGNPTRQRHLDLGEPTPVEVWRPIHYLGSKLRLVRPILDSVEHVDRSGGTVCDLFAGSGTVSLAFAGVRSVVATDIQEYSRVICSALLRPAALTSDEYSTFSNRVERLWEAYESAFAPVLSYEDWAISSSAADPSPLCDLIEHGAVFSQTRAFSALQLRLDDTRKKLASIEKQCIATRHFAAKYFSYRQTLWLDAILNAVDDAPNRCRDTLLAAVVSTASDIVNSVGKQFAQPMKPHSKSGTIKHHLIRQMCRDRSICVKSTFSHWLARYCQLQQTRPHEVIRADYRVTLNQLQDVSVVYADPPYTRDHYSRFYHVLETLCLRDDPAVARIRPDTASAISRGAYRVDRHQSPFCIKSKAPSAFAELFSGCCRLGVPVVVSYSPSIKNGHPRLMTIDALVSIASDFFGRVTVRSANRFAHSKLNKRELHLEASDSAEVLIECVC